MFCYNDNEINNLDELALSHISKLDVHYFLQTIELFFLKLGYYSVIAFHLYALLMADILMDKKHDPSSSVFPATDCQVLLRYSYFFDEILDYKQPQPYFGFFTIVVISYVLDSELIRLYQLHEILVHSFARIANLEL